MKMLNCFRLLCHPASILLFMKSYAMFRTDPRCLLVKLLQSAWRSAGEEKVVPYEGKLVYSSFLPPIPSKAANQVFDALDDTAPKLMDAMRGREGAYDKAVEAVKLCREAGLYTMTQHSYLDAAGNLYP